MSHQNSTTLTDQELDEVISRRERMLVDRPNDTKLLRNLLKLLDCRVSRASGNGAYSMCQSALSSHFKNCGTLETHLDTNFLINSINEYREIISEFEINRQISINQIHEGVGHKINGQPVACNKYLDFFNKNQIICGICYNCYKVQIVPSNVIDLIKLSIILKFTKLDKDNCRKCMIELREDVNNPYKGYIYCESEEDALSCIRTLRIDLERFGVDHMACRISHGCSEYGLRYPEFKFSDDGAHRTQKQPDDWKKIEEDSFSEPDFANEQILNFTTQEITLRDVICFETWIKYSEIIGDDSHKRFQAVPSDGKLSQFIDRVTKQAHVRNAQLIELQD